MKKMLIALFCLALAAPAAQAQNVNAAPQKKDQAQNASRAAHQAAGSERRHGTAGMRNNDRLKMEQAQERRSDIKKTDVRGINTPKSAIPTR